MNNMRTRKIIEDLADYYLKHPNYHRGWIDDEWIGIVTDTLKLKQLSDDELCDMWDMVYLTLDHAYNYYNSNEDWRTAMKYLDVQSAFTEVVNVEARRRKRRKGE
jgi:hypothetical protein